MGAIILVAVLIPYNYIPCILIVLVMVTLVSFTNPAIASTKNMEAITKAPVYAHTTTSLEGLFSIRAFHAQNRFDEINMNKIDRNHEALLALLCTKTFQAL